MTRDDLRRSLLDLRLVVDDADAVTRDLFRPRRRRRELGPVLQSRRYREAYKKIDQMLTYLLSTYDDGMPSDQPAVSRSPSPSGNRNDQPHTSH